MPSCAVRDWGTDDVLLTRPRHHIRVRRFEFDVGCGKRSVTVRLLGYRATRTIDDAKRGRVVVGCQPDVLCRVRSSHSLDDPVRPQHRTWSVLGSAIRVAVGPRRGGHDVMVAPLRARLAGRWSSCCGPDAHCRPAATDLQCSHDQLAGTNTHSQLINMADLTSYPRHHGRIKRNALACTRKQVHLAEIYAIPILRRWSKSSMTMAGCPHLVTTPAAGGCEVQQLTPHGWIVAASWPTCASRMSLVWLPIHDTSPQSCTVRSAPSGV
jgi:hypothetical protein